MKSEVLSSLQMQYSAIHLVLSYMMGLGLSPAEIGMTLAGKKEKVTIYRDLKKGRIN